MCRDARAGGPRQRLPFSTPSLADRRLTHSSTPPPVSPASPGDGTFEAYQLPEINEFSGWGCTSQRLCNQFKDMWVYRVKWMLPKNFTCDHCKLQWVSHLIRCYSVTFVRSLFRCGCLVCERTRLRDARFLLAWVCPPTPRLPLPSMPRTQTWTTGHTCWPPCLKDNPQAQCQNKQVFPTCGTDGAQFPE